MNPVRPDGPRAGREGLVAVQDGWMVGSYDCRVVTEGRLVAERLGHPAGPEDRHVENASKVSIKSDRDYQSVFDGGKQIFYERSVSVHRRSDRRTDDGDVSRPAESAVNERSGMLPVRVNPIGMGTLKWEAFEAGPDVVAGTVDLECGIRLRSHGVKVADHSMEVDYPIRTASGRGGDYYCATTTGNPAVDVLFFPCKISPETRVAPRIIVCVRKRES